MASDVEVRSLNQDELWQLEEQRRFRESLPEDRPLTPTELQVRRERIEAEIQRREIEGDPKEGQRFREERDMRLTPMGRALARDPKAFRIVSFGPDGSVAGDLDMLDEMEAQHRARRAVVDAESKTFRMMGIGF